MDLNPTYTSVGSLFENKPMFFIPKYQRAYAWETESIKDFIKDLKTCFLKRKAQDAISHFWGGILSVEYPVLGVVKQHQYEIIDGQQRAATFTILMACIVKMYKELLHEATSSGDTTNKLVLKKRIEDFSNRFIEFNQEVQRHTTTVEVLKLSKPDHNFYRDLIREKNPSPSRDSHKKLLDAYTSISQAIQEMIDTSNLVSKMDDLEVIQHVIDQDFTVLHMVTKDKKDAFRLFQVINDRGTSLTEGDLLRAKTLEILEGFSSEQNSVEDLWDKILSDHPNKTANYLHWIYESNKGKRAPQNALFDNFIDAFFPQHTSNLTETDAAQIYQTLRNIDKDIIKCRKLEDGEGCISLLRMCQKRVKMKKLVKLSNKDEVNKMTPSDHQQLKAHLKAVAKILYRNTEPTELKTFESIEKAVRQKMLSEVGPEIGSFFFQQYQEFKQENPEK